MIHDNSRLKQAFETYLKSRLKTKEIEPTLEIIQIGKNLASTKYIQAKQQAGQRLGIRVNLHEFSDSADLGSVQQVLDEAQKQKHGLIIQLPVPKQFRQLVDQIPPSIDVDLLGDQADKLWSKKILPPTIGAIDLTLKDIFTTKFPNRVSKSSLKPNLDFFANLDFSGLNVAIIGRGKLVGAPAIKYFLDRGAGLISLDKHTRNPEELTKQADIVVSAAGQKNLLTDKWLQPEAIVIDASTSESNGILVGDLNRDNLPESITLSPSPGGIGGLTVLYLFYNLIRLVG